MAITVDYLIIGQGIAGTFLSYYLEQENKSYVLIDRNDRSSPSRIAAGIINPVTGRRMVKAWMIDELLPLCWKEYSALGTQLGVTAISQKSVIDFFPNPFMRESFLKRIQESDQYVHAFAEQNHFNTEFNYEFGCGEIRPAYIVHAETILPAWRDHLRAKNALREEAFSVEALDITENGIRYDDITASGIIFCDGAGGADNPWFKQLPFAPNKGEALIVEIPGLTPHHIYKKSMTLAPLDKPDLFWIGSVYQWDFENAEPSEAFRNQAQSVLKEWVRLPFTVRDHVAGVRPATLERRPFVGTHPSFPNVSILNGMGTKGFSLAPFFAKQLVDHLLYNTPLQPEADIARFRRILSR